MTEDIKKPYSKEKIGVVVILVLITAAIFLAIGFWAGVKSGKSEERSTTISTPPVPPAPSATAATSTTAATTASVSPIATTSASE